MLVYDRGLKSSSCSTKLPLFPFQETWYWQGNSNAAEVVLSGVRCKGTELSILQCQHHGPVHCPRGGGRFSAGVTCTSSEYFRAAWGCLGLDHRGAITEQFSVAAGGWREKQQPLQSSSGWEE